MNVALGSRNPAKVTAVERALEQFDPAVIPVEVDSGVAEQPRSIEATARGAENRARRAFERTDTTLGIGLEGGVASFDGVDGLWLVMWGGATDGEQVELAAGPSLRLPGDVITSLEEGAELGPVMAEREKQADIATGAGAAGALTAGLTDRPTALTQAVAGAVGPFIVAGTS